MVIVFPHQNYKNGSSTGTNSINTAVRYLLDEDGRDKKPEVVKGDVGFVMDVTNSIDNQQKYTSLVLSFRDEEKPTNKQQLEIIKRFEAVAFAGLAPGDYTALWVKHEDKGNTELHCLVPKIHLGTGKALNIRPPGKFSEDLMDSFRDLVNLDYGWKDVVEGKSKIFPKFHSYELKKLELGTADSRTKFKEKLTEFIVGQTMFGNINNRDDVVQTLKGLKLEVVREGDDYVSIKHPSDPEGKNIRLKGGVYGKSFEISGGREKEIRNQSHKSNSSREQEIREKFERCVSARAKFNQGRYSPDKKTLNFGNVAIDFTPKPIGGFSHHKESEIRINYSESINFPKSKKQEVGNGRVDPIRTRANSVNQQFDKAIRKTESNCGKLSAASSAAATTNKQFSATNSEVSKEVDRIRSAHPPMNSSALGSVSSLEMSIAGEVAKQANAKSPLEKAAIQNRINELIAQLEIAKQRYIEEQRKGLGYGGR